MTFRQAFALSLSVLLALPLWAGATVIGTVQASKLATLHGANLVAGTTICDGDTIDVPPEGSAWVNLPGGGAVLIGQNSEVLFKKSSEAAEFEIESGQAKFRSSGITPVHAILGDATVKPLKGAAIGYITMYGQSSALIGAEKGDILIMLAHDGSSKTIHEGSAIAVRLVPDPQGEDKNVVPGMRRKHRVILWGAAIVGGAAFIGILLNNDERNVSPSNFKKP